MNKEFYGLRADRYSNLEWANKQEYIDFVVNAVSPSPYDIVLDVGTGTGVIARNIKPLVKCVYAIDLSPDMLKYARDGYNTELGDIRHTDFPENQFDKILARQVFHHIVEGTQDAVCECYRILKSGGLMVISEGVPPEDKFRDDYTRLFRHKEHRLTFTAQDIETLMRNSGFCDIQTQYLWLRRMSVRNWLNNSALPEYRKDLIYQQHIELNNKCKSAYNMIITDEDCFIDMRQCAVVGKK